MERNDFKEFHMTTSSYPPGPKDKPLIGSLFPFFRDPTGLLLSVARDYGDIVRIRIGLGDAFLINQPDYIQDVLMNHYQNFIKGKGFLRAKSVLGEGLLTSEGDFHRHQRRLAQPAFHRQRIAAYGAVMTEYGARMGERWQDGETLDIAREMMRLTLAIVARTLFHADVESETNEIGKAISIFREEWWNTTILPFLPFSRFLEKLPIPSLRRLNKARESLDVITYRIINEHRASGRDRGDLLSMLLLAQDEEGDGGGMTDVQVRDEVMTILFAGHETTASALTWTWYLLSQNPEVEIKLHAELDSVLAGKLPTADDVGRLTYTRMVLSEAMRIYPPVWILGRRPIKDYKIDSYIVPADSVIIVSQWVTHHDPRYYPDPFRFDPERWTPEAQASRPKFAYFPFGGGPRQCMGEQFAWMEGVLLLATLAQNWQMRLVPGHTVEPQPLVTLRPKYGMRMKLERRK
jgi:cytochrome P450